MFESHFKGRNTVVHELSHCIDVVKRELPTLTKTCPEDASTIFKLLVNPHYWEKIEKQ